jgi:hypothetical protein
MDIDYAAEHLTLDINKLMAFNDVDFTHDVCGIQNNLDRNAGVFINCFIPRAAQQK